MFDTLRYSKVLEAAGVSRDQAEAHVKIIAEIVEGDLATKQDVRELKRELTDEMQKMEYRLIIKLSSITGAIVAFAIAVTAAITKLIG